MKAKILDPNFKYIPAVETRIQDTWRKFGWRPKNEMSNVRSVDASEAITTERRIRPQIARVR